MGSRLQKGTRLVMPAAANHCQVPTCITAAIQVCGKRQNMSCERQCNDAKEGVAPCPGGGGGGGGSGVRTNKGEMNQVDALSRIAWLTECDGTQPERGGQKHRGFTPFMLAAVSHGHVPSSQQASGYHIHLIWRVGGVCLALILSRAGQEDEHEYEPGAVQRYQALNGSIQEYLVNGYLQGKQALNDYQARYTSSEGQLTNCGKIMGEDGHNDDLITTSNDKAWLDAP